MLHDMMVHLDSRIDWVWNQLKGTPLGSLVGISRKGSLRECPSPKVGSASQEETQIERGAKKEQGCLLPPLPAGECVCPLTMLLSTLANIQLQIAGPFSRPKTSGSPGVFQAFITTLRLLRCSVTRAEQLPGSQPLQHADISVGLPSLFV